MAAHSQIGASSMKRWSACPGSVRLSAGLPTTASVYAAEGSVAHAVAEACLASGGSPEALVGTKREHEGFVIEITAEMAEAVTVYVDHIRELLALPGCSDHGVEARFHLAELHEDLFGTADFWALIGDTLYVRDYKHGAGVAVEVQDNPQLLYYAVGAASKVGFKGFSKVNLGIVQPRCPHRDGPVRVWEFPAADLIDFSLDLVDAARATEAPDAPLVPGDHCRWCPAAAICPALRAKADEMAALEFGPESSYDPAKLADTLRWVDVLEGWVRSVRAFAFGEAESGRCPPGFKLVPKRANRKWREGLDLVGTFSLHGLTKEDLYGEPPLKSVAQVEKLLGKKLAKEVLPELVTAESTGHALVPESDPRAPAKASAADDFA